MTSKKKLRKALRWELELHWNGLNEARRSAIRPGAWTIGCEHHAERIRELTQLVGATRWEAVQISLLQDGTYQRLTAEMGFAGPEFTPDLEYIADLERATGDGTFRHCNPSERK